MRTICLLLLFLGFAVGASLDDLERERQEELYYVELPATVTSLVASPIPLADYIARYRETDDEILRFNLVVILDKRLRTGAIVGEERTQAIAFLAECLREGNPWIRTEAVYALGNAQGAAADAAIRACLDDVSQTVVYHAVIALIQIHGEQPDLSPEQEATLAAVHRAQAEGTHNELAMRELRTYMNRGGF